MKFVHMLHSSEPLPWKQWFLSKIQREHCSTNQDSTFLGCIIQEELNRYRALTKVIVHNGVATSFYFNEWHTKGPLVLAYLALFSHTTSAHVLVQDVMGNGTIALPVQDRLTHAATTELHDIQRVLAGIAVSPADDELYLVNCSQPGYTSPAAYAALNNSDYVHPDANTIWSTKLPTK